MKKDLPILTKQDKDNILDLFFRKELRIGEKVIDNSDKAISKELDIHSPSVSHFLHMYLKAKYSCWNETKIKPKPKS